MIRFHPGIVLIISLIAVSNMARVGCSQNQAASPVAADDSALLKAMDHWSCVFADSEITLRYSWPKPVAAIISFNWQISVGERRLAGGHGQPVQPVDDGSREGIRCVLEMPSVKTGGEVSTRLQLTFHAEDGRTFVRTQPLVIFAADPFQDRHEMLRRLNIQLYDPLGLTASVFEASEIPFHKRRTLAALDDLQEGLLIVGEGINWNDQKTIGHVAMRAAERGLVVLCLAPANAAAGMKTNSLFSAISPSELRLMREEIAQEFNTKLDTQQWLGGHSSVARFLVDSKDDQVTVRPSNSTSAWPWLDMHWRNPEADRRQGRLILCGLGIVKYWPNGPVPRYFLRGILESISEQAALYAEK